MRSKGGGIVARLLATMGWGQVQIPVPDVREGVAEKVKSLFAARQRYWAGQMTKPEFNRLVAQAVFEKWLPLAQATMTEWRWLAELSAYLELKFFGIE